MRWIHNVFSVFILPPGGQPHYHSMLSNEDLTIEVFWSFIPHRLKCGQRSVVQDIAQLATCEVNQVHTICTITKFRL